MDGKTFRAQHIQIDLIKDILYISADVSQLDFIFANA